MTGHSCEDIMVTTLKALKASMGSRWSEEEVLGVLGLLLMRGSKEAKKRGLKIAVELVESVPLLAVRLLPCLLYALKLWSNEPDLQVALLHSLPLIGQHKLVAKQVARVVSELAAPDAPVAVQTIGITMAAQLCNVSRHGLGTLQAALTFKGGHPLSQTLEVRLAKASAMLCVCRSDPNQGLELVPHLQIGLVDEDSGVVALAIEAIAELCACDAMDFATSCRVVLKKIGPEPGEGYDELVCLALASLYGAGAGAALLEDEEEEDEEEQRGHSPGLDQALRSGLERLAGLLGNESLLVRQACHSALCNYALLLVSLQEQGSEVEEDLARVRDHLLVAVRTGEAGDMCEEALTALVLQECRDPSIWKGQPRGLAQSSGSSSAPSSRLLAALPTAQWLVDSYHQGTSSPGLAGALLWTYKGGEGTVQERLAAMLRLVRGLLEDEEGAASGPQPWQGQSPLGVQRFVSRCMELCLQLAREEGEPDPEGRASTRCLELLQEACCGSPLWSLVHASWAAALPDTRKCEACAVIEAQLQELGDGNADGQVMLPICIAVIAKGLPQAHAHEVKRVGAALSELLLACGQMGVAAESRWYWLALSLGVLTDWCSLHPTHPLSKTLAKTMAKTLLKALANRMKTQALADLTAEMFGAADEWGGAVKQGCPSASDIAGCDDMCLPLLLALGHCFNAFQATGLRQELLQCSAIVETCNKGGVPGAGLALVGAMHARVCALALRPHELQQVIEGRLASIDAEGAMILAGLVAAGQGQVSLPGTLVTAVFEALCTAAASTPPTIHGCALLGLAALSGCPSILGCLGVYAPVIHGVPEGVTRPMIETARAAAVKATEGLSLRPKSAAWRMLGCLAAVREDYEQGCVAPLGAGGVCQASAGGIALPREGTAVRALLEIITAPGDAPAAALATSLTCLAGCHLRTLDAQMPTALAFVFQGQYDASAQLACSTFAAAGMRRSSSYAHWVKGLLLPAAFLGLDSQIQLSLLSELGLVLESITETEVGGLIQGLLALDMAHKIRAQVLSGVASFLARCQSKGQAMCSLVQLVMEELSSFRWPGDGHKGEDEEGTALAACLAALPASPPLPLTPRTDSAHAYLACKLRGRRPEVTLDDVGSYIVADTSGKGTALLPYLSQALEGTSKEEEVRWLLLLTDMCGLPEMSGEKAIHAMEVLASGWLGGAHAKMGLDVTVPALIKDLPHLEEKLLTKVLRLARSNGAVMLVIEGCKHSSLLTTNRLPSATATITQHILRGVER
ncbi:unnamed protein product [Chrysoparadoxa australica]